MSALVSATPRGARLRVRLTPKADSDAVDGVGADAAGEPHLKVRVRAAPENGLANAALESVLAKFLDAPKRAVRVAKGAGARVKLVDIEGADAAQISARLTRLPEKAKEKA